MHEDRMKAILSAIPDTEDIDPSEIMQISGDLDSKDYTQLVGCVIYLRKRELEKLSRYESFKAAFPTRAIASEVERSNFETDLVNGDPLSKGTINVKAKRLETSVLYKQIHALLSTSFYVAYAVDRLRVLDEVLDMSLDRGVSDRDRHNYMKLFLDETRKPESAKGFELNLNVTSNTVNIASVEDKMNSIAQALNHASAGEVLDMIEKGKIVDGADTED